MGEIIKQAATLEVTDIEEVEFDYTAIEMVQTQGASAECTGQPKFILNAQLENYL